MTRSFLFEHTWRVPADPSRTYAVLEDAAGYHVWWPQVRQVRSADDESGEADVRSLLPFTLRLGLRRDVADPVRRHLRVAIEGDLEGYAAWDLSPDGAGTSARFTQEVEVTHRALRRWSRLGAPVLRLNHAWMMRSGERGLAAHLRR